MNYQCPPMSRKRLRCYARTIRDSLHLDGVLRFPAIEFLETLPSLIGDETFYYDYISDTEWENPAVHAYYDFDDNCVKVKESVYVGACEGNGRDRMTITHECSHVLLLRHSHLTLTRSFSGNIPVYQDPEWQAKCLAGELMVPFDLVGNMSAVEIATKCGVSLDAAEYQLKCRYK